MTIFGIKNKSMEFATKQNTSTIMTIAILLIATGAGYGLYNFIFKDIFDAPVPHPIAQVMPATPAPEVVPEIADITVPPQTGSDVDVPIAAPVAEATPPVESVPATIQGDLPVPAGVQEANSAPPAVTPSAEQTPQLQLSEATAAELAIVQNTSTQDKKIPITGQKAEVKEEKVIPLSLSQQKNSETSDVVGNLLSNEAVVRDTPEQYVIVKKSHEAGDIDSRLTAARVAVSSGNFSAALQLFNDLYQSYPKDKRILMGRAVALNKMGQLDDALAAYEEVLEADPKDLDALTNMLGLLKKQNPALALEKLRELRETYPSSAQITEQLALVYADAGQMDDAVKYLEMAEALNPGAPSLLFNKAVLLDKVGKLKEAADIYNYLLRLAAEGNADARQLPLQAIQNRLTTLR